MLERLARQAFSRNLRRISLGIERKGLVRQRLDLLPVVLVSLCNRQYVQPLDHSSRGGDVLTKGTPQYVHQQI